MEAASASSTSSTSSPPPPLPEEENTSQNGVGVMTGMVTQTTEINKAVVWPPSKGASALASTAATRYMRQVEQNEDHKSNQYTLSRELFKPGKFNGEEVWNPAGGPNPEANATGVMGTQGKGRGGCGGYRKLDDFLHNESGPNRMPSYHVPPGTTRTRKAQENYQKHLVELK